MVQKPNYTGKTSPFESAFTSWKYADYLQARQFSDAIQLTIDDSTNMLLSANKSFEARAGIGNAVVKESIEGGFERITFTVNSMAQMVEHEFKETRSILEAGFSEVYAQLSSVNAGIDELIRIARSPSRNWAYEQFELAREEFRRGLYPEALTSVDRAITGHGSHVGLGSDFRFHMLRGIVLLGSYANSDTEIVDPVKAESALLQAARYAASGYSHEVANAMSLASAAAAAQGDWTRALAHTREGLRFDRQPGLYYQAAKALFRLGDTASAIENAAKAIARSERFVLLLLVDKHVHFSEAFSMQVLQFVSNALTEACKRHVALLDREFEKVADLQHTLTTGKIVKAREEIRLQIVVAKGAIEVAQKVPTGVLDLFDFKIKLNALQQSIMELPDAFKNKIVADLRTTLRENTAEILKYDSAVNYKDEVSWKRFTKAPATACWIYFIFAMIMAFFAPNWGGNDGKIEWVASGVFGAIVIYPLTFIIFLMYGLVAEPIVNSTRKATKGSLQIVGQNQQKEVQHAQSTTFSRPGALDVWLDFEKAVE